MAKKKLYYGWVVLVATVICTGVAVCMGTSLFSIFVTPVTTSLNISTAAFMVSSSIGTAIGIGLAPFVGLIVDKKGVPFAVSILGISFTIGYGVLSFADSLPMIYVGYTIIGVGKTFPLMLLNIIASRWFKKYRGLAAGICSAGSGLFGMVLSPVMAATIASSGYIGGYRLLAVLSLVAVFGVGRLLIRNRPEEMGLFPDGADAPADAVVGQVKEATGMTQKEAVKTVNFWIIFISFFLFGTVSMSILNSYNAAFQAKGFDPMVAAIAVSTYAGVSIASKAISGWLSDKFPVKGCVAIFYGLVAVACAIMLVITPASSTIMLYIFAVVFALGNASWVPMLMKTLTTTFGLKAFGGLQGLVMMGVNIGSLIGPIMMGTIFDVTGSYSLGYIVVLIMVLVSALLLWFVKKPQQEW